MARGIVASLGCRERPHLTRMLVAFARAHVPSDFTFTSIQVGGVASSLSRSLSLSRERERERERRATRDTTREVTTSYIIVYCIVLYYIILH